MNVPGFSLVQMSALLAALPDPVFVLTHSGLYAAIFGGTDTRYYHDGQWLVGQRLTDVLEADKADWFLQEIRHTLALGRLHVVEYSLSGHDIKGLSSEGPQEAIWFEGRVQPLDFLVLGEPAVLWVASNITARHDLEHRLRVLSETDELTGLPNRRHLMERLGVSARQTHVDRRWRPWLTIRCQWAASGAATAPQSGWPCAWEAL